ncbi:MAG: rhomboid family intramembrane serine protease, partial [Bacteroidetes bacterium]
VLFVWVWAFAGFFTPLAISIFLGGLLGFGFVYLLRNGTDLTERIWNFYVDNQPKPRMKVKYGGGKPQSPSRNKQRPTADGSSGVPQEVIDGILDKIHDQGYESLSREEKELLFKASTQKDDEGAH